MITDWGPLLNGLFDAVVLFSLLLVVWVIHTIRDL
jgi:hypothetical protein